MLLEGFGEERVEMRAKTLRITASSLILGAFLVPMAALAQNEIQHGPGIDTPADGRGNYVRQLPPRAQSSTGSVVQGNGISYHNGPVMRNGVNIYYIWYGNWAQDPTANAILTDLASNIGGSPYFNINTTYGDTVGNVPNSVKYGGAVTDSGSLGTSVSDNGIWTLVSNSIKTFGADPNGVYFVLTAPYVAETSGFLSQYCAWHTYNYFGSTKIKYAFVGNPAAGMGSCSVQSTSPNGDAQADAMATGIAHELEEAATDPELTAWYDSTGAENADKCAWTFGTTYTTSNGSKANMMLGSRNYLIQRNWVNAGGGYCAVSYDYVGTPDFSLSVSPGSQTVTAGQTTGNYSVTATPLNGWSKSVTYAVTAGLPAGAVANVSGNVITVSTSSSTPGGSYNFTISGTDGTLTHTTSATLVVSTPLAPTFSINVSPSSQSVKRPRSGSASVAYTVAVTSTAGYTGSVSLSWTGGTTGLTLSAGPVLISGGSGTTTLTATVTSSAKKGNQKLTITGDDGTTTESASASLRIN
jgi:Phosphate-induced protein 1 conserved region